MDEYIKVIQKFIADKVEKVGADKVILGLSGGLDSATILKLCIDSLDVEKIYCIIMPERASPPEDITDARWLVKLWNVEWDEINIDDILKHFPADPDEKLAYANLKARVRMCIEYHAANVRNGIVVGTSNKSELLLGYTTKYGDSASDFLPIGDVYKSEVRELAERIGVPERFLEKTPRAGLWEGQTDEDELGYSYDVLDKVLKGIEAMKPLEEIADQNGISMEDVQNIKYRVERNAHKRKIPTIVKLRNRTIGLDWREFSY